jgi:hypothetical protein
MPEIRITVDGRPAATIELAAPRYNMEPSSLRGALTRLGDAIRPAAMLDGRKPLYFIAALDKAIKARPGKGVGGGKPRRAPAADAS